jgi:hypothetical protein
MTLGTGEDTLIGRRKLYIALSGGIVLEEAVDLSYNRLVMMMTMIGQRYYYAHLYGMICTMCSVFGISERLNKIHGVHT